MRLKALTLTQDRLVSAAKMIGPELAAGITVAKKGEKREKGKKGKKGKKGFWRTDSKSFLPAHPSRSLTPGIQTYSAGWLAQGHKVAVWNFTTAIFFGLNPRPSPKDTS
jgi:hypothetical protein